MWNLKNDTKMNLFIKQKQTHRLLENNLTVTKGERGGGSDKLEEFGINRYTLLYIKIDKQQGPTIKHREIYSISCNNL